MVRYLHVFVSSLLLVVVVLVGALSSLVIAGQTALAAYPTSAGKLSTSIPPPSCLSSVTLPRCYSPQQIRVAYGVQPLLNVGITGKGRTIVIVGNNAYPNMAENIHLYDQMFGLSDPTLNIIEPFGPVSSNGEAPQIVQDAEFAHAIAPGATIDLLLVDASKASSPAERVLLLLNGTKYAIDHNLGDVLSLSFAAGESCLGTASLQKEHQIFQEAQAKHITVLAASGDIGASEYCSFSGPLIKDVSYPASDPLVTAVGATTLNVDAKTGVYQGESGWTQVPGDPGASGGGFSTTFVRPAYQNGVSGIGASRGLPDVVSDGDFFTRMVIAYTVGGTVHFGPSGGTASATPQWAGIIALADQFAGHRLGFVNAALYRVDQSPLSRLAFHDITTGNNTFAYAVSVGGPITTIQGYSAGPGWDAVTGLGSPRVAELVPLLVQSVCPDDGNRF